MIRSYRKYSSLPKVMHDRNLNYYQVTHIGLECNFKGSELVRFEISILTVTKGQVIRKIKDFKTLHLMPI